MSRQITITVTWLVQLYTLMLLSATDVTLLHMLHIYPHRLRPWVPEWCRECFRVLEVNLDKLFHPNGKNTKRQVFVPVFKIIHVEKNLPVVCSALGNQDKLSQSFFFGMQTWNVDPSATLYMKSYWCIVSKTKPETKGNLSSLLISLLHLLHSLIFKYCNHLCSNYKWGQIIRVVQAASH